MLHQHDAASPLACQLQQLNAERDRLPSRRLARTDILARALQQLHCPVHLLYGEHDRYYLHQHREIEAVLRSCPGFVAMRAIAGAGHWAQFEQAHAFHAALFEALDERVHAGQSVPCP